MYAVGVTDVIMKNMSKMEGGSWKPLISRFLPVQVKPTRG